MNGYQGNQIINLLNDYADKIIAVSQIVYDRHVESGIKSNKFSVPILDTRMPIQNFF